MTDKQAFQVSCEISQNENKSIRELTDSTICFYLVDKGFEETADNVAKVRAA